MFGCDQSNSIVDTVWSGDERLVTALGVTLNVIRTLRITLCAALPTWIVPLVRTPLEYVMLTAVPFMYTVCAFAYALVDGTSIRIIVVRFDAALPIPSRWKYVLNVKTLFVQDGASGNVELVRSVWFIIILDIVAIQPVTSIICVDLVSVWFALGTKLCRLNTT